MRRLTHEQFMERLSPELLQSIQITGCYRAQQVGIDVECLQCGHQWQPRPNNLINGGTGCPVCFHRRRRGGLEPGEWQRVKRERERLYQQQRYQAMTAEQHEQRNERERELRQLNVEEARAYQRRWQQRQRDRHRAIRLSEVTNRISLKPRPRRIKQRAQQHR